MSPVVQPFLLKKDTGDSCDPITEGRTRTSLMIQLILRSTYLLTFLKLSSIFTLKAPCYFTEVNGKAA